MDATAIILAAGGGTRMKSNHCKVSHKILGKPMSSGSSTPPSRPAAAASWSSSAATPTRCAPYRRRLRQQRHQGRVRRADRAPGHRPRRKGRTRACGIAQGPVVVLNGDLPLITADTVAKFAQTVATGELACTVMTMTPPDPFGYGRIKLAPTARLSASSSRRTARPSRPPRCSSATPAATPSTALSLPRISTRSATTTRSPSTTCPTCSRSSRVTARQCPSSTAMTTATAWASTAASSSRSSPPSRATASTSAGWPRALPSSIPRRPGSAPMPLSAATPSCGRRHI